MLRNWDEIPDFMKCDEVRSYYDILSARKWQLSVKRIFDVLVSALLIVILAIPMLVIAIMIRIDSPGPAFYRQERVTAYGKKFRIHKFRTMVDNAETKGTSVTVGNDSRITMLGSKIRKYRVDEIPQLFDVLSGNMSFVGTRPEAVKYVKQYSKEMNATLLLPAGITSEASIRYRDEQKLLNSADDVDKVYVEEVLPQKMKYNLQEIKRFSLAWDILIMCRTIYAIIGRDSK